MPSIIITALHHEEDGLHIGMGDGGLRTTLVDDPQEASVFYQKAVDFYKDEPGVDHTKTHNDPREYFRETEIVLDDDSRVVISLLP